MKMRLHELLFVALVFGWAMCGPACSHPSVAATRDAAGCLAACDGASVVETAPNGSMCRCWIQGGQYTFGFPDSAAKLSYSRERWGYMRSVIEKCRKQGLGWSETPDGKDVACVKPEPATIDPHASLGRVDGRWPRFVHRPAWLLWRAPSSQS